MAEEEGGVFSISMTQRAMSRCGGGGGAFKQDWFMGSGQTYVDPNLVIPHPLAAMVFLFLC